MKRSPPTATASFVPRGRRAPFPREKGEEKRLSRCFRGRKRRRGGRAERVPKRASSVANRRRTGRSGRRLSGQASLASVCVAAVASLSGVVLLALSVSLEESVRQLAAFKRREVSRRGGASPLRQTPCERPLLQARTNAERRSLGARAGGLRPPRDCRNVRDARSPVLRRA